MRHFTNRLDEFVPGSKVQIDRAFWKRVILDYTESIVKYMPPVFDHCDGSLYVGCAGVSYMFYYIAKSDVFKAERADLLTKARNYAEVSLSYSESKRCRDSPKSAFLLGGGGVYAVGSLIYHDIGQKPVAEQLIKKYLALGSLCEPVNFLSSGGDELLVGRAGYLCGALLMNRKFGEVIGTSTTQKIFNSMIHSGTLYATKHKSRSPLMYAYYDTEYLGAAHGLSGILQMLMSYPQLLKSDPTVENQVRDSVDFMLGLMQRNGNIAPAMDEVQGGRPESEELVHWCHGAPGVIYLFAKAFLTWKDEKYLQACYRCGECIWRKGLLKKGPGICHGVAGNGYAFLLLYRMTGDEQFLHRAVKFAEFLISDEYKRQARTPDTPYSLYEGLAGTVCFLNDLLQPQKAEFPFFDVFQKK